MSKAKDIMTSNPITCQDTDSVYDAVRVMKQRNTGVVPIVDDTNACCGIITDRDICLQVILNGQDPKLILLKNVMTRNVLTSKPEDDINRVLSQMENRRVKRIVVVDDHNRCVGIISEADIVRRLHDQAKISELTSAVYSK